jgi:O-antigen biosynthesis protein WbqV
LADFLIGFVCFSVAYLCVAPQRPYFNAAPGEQLAFIHLALAFAVLAMVMGLLNGTYRAPWRFASILTSVDALRSALFTILAFGALSLLISPLIAVPLALFLVAFIFHCSGMMAVRLALRASNDGAISRILLPRSLTQALPVAKNALIVAGPVVRVEAYLRTMQRDNLSGTIVGAIVLEDGWINQRLRGVEVLGQPNHLRELIHARSPEIDGVLFVSEPSDFVDADTLTAMKEQGMTLLRLPRAEDLDSLRTSPARPREIRLDDLLPRQPMKLDPEPIRAMISQRRIMITGAGGSIGSELVRQIASLQPAHLSMIDNCEHNLFTVEGMMKHDRPDVSASARYCDVRNRDRIMRVIKEERPDIIFHAAALKHLSLMQENPSECALTNVVGTNHVCEAAAAHDVKALVLVSTDKAVRPCNVMGATKRLAEAVIHRLQESRDTQTRSVIVRFGNVLGSSGSVVPLFKEQIRRGGPVRVTDRDVTRFFMTIPESVLLTLHATAQALSKPASKRNGVYVLEMGEPVKILDLARRMIAFYAAETQRKIDIEFVGLRPGEKLNEELVDDNESAYRSSTPGIMEVRAEEPPVALSPEEVGELERLARQSDDASVHSFLFELLARVRPEPEEATVRGPSPIAARVRPTEELESAGVVSLADRRR